MRKISKIARLRKIKEEGYFSKANKIDGLKLDAVTVNLLIKVHDALSQEQQEKFLAMHITEMVAISWKLVKK
jgi:hypothetical protein